MILTVLLGDLRLPKQSVEQQLNLFEEHGLLVKAESDTLSYTPARPLEELNLKAVIDTVREPGPKSHLKSTLNQNNSTINELLKEVDLGFEQLLSNKTIRDIVKSADKTNDKENESLINTYVTEFSKVRNK